MASLKYFLFSPFLFLCLSYTFANGVEGQVSNVGAGPKTGPKLGISGIEAGSRAGPKGVDPIIVNGVGVGVGDRVGYKSETLPPGFGGPRAGPKGVDPIIVNGVGVGDRVGYKSETLPPGFGGPRAGLKGVDPIVNGFGVGVGVGVGGRPGGYRPRPIIEPYDRCTLGYVCPGNEPWACSSFEYGVPCESYNFHPMSASSDLHEVNINWAKTKPATTAQHGGSGPVIHIDSAH